MVCKLFEVGGSGYAGFWLLQFVMQFWLFWFDSSETTGFVVVAVWQALFWLSCLWFVKCF